MVYECECGTVIKRKYPWEIRKHLDSDKHHILMNGGSIDIFNRWRAKLSLASYCKNQNQQVPADLLKLLKQIQDTYLHTKE